MTMPRLLPLVCMLLAVLVACGTQATPQPTETRLDTPEIIEEVATEDPSPDAELQQIVNQYVNDCSSDPIEGLGPEFAENYPTWLAWIEFVYLNCEVTSSPTITWENWATNVGVYLPGGAAPPAWGSPQLTNYALQDSAEISGHRATTISGNPILYEIRMNQDNFDYIVQRQLYSKNCQIQLFAGTPCDGDDSDVVFPWSAVEIKTAWIPLTPGDPNNSRYFTVETTYVDRDGNTVPVLAGMAGFHMSSKVLPNWYWATFEQVDNQSVTGIDPTDGTPPDVQELNTFMQQVVADAFPNTPWQYYALRGTQINFVDDAGNPTILANTLIETDFQTSSSCITCHALATRGSLAQGRLAFFNITDAGMQGYVGNVAGQNYFDSFGDPVCYDGTTDYFTECSSGANVYRQLDFVWSLREAD